MTAYLNRTRETLVYLRAETGDAPLLDVLPSGVSLKYRKTGGVIETKTLDTSNWLDLGLGQYVIVWSSDDMSSSGEFYWRLEVTGSYGGFKEGKFDIDLFPPYLSTEQPYCVVSGNVVDLGGNSSQDSLLFRPRSVPTKVGESLLTSSHISTITDAWGNFSVKLIRGIQVVVDIYASGIKHIITVPDAPSANIIDLLPPIPPIP